MKLYCDVNSLRLVGKAWEVRAKLKQIARANIPLQNWLQHRVPTKPY